MFPYWRRRDTLQIDDSRGSLKLRCNYFYSLEEMIKGNVDAKIMFFEHQDSNVVTTISNSFKRMPELQIEDATSSFGIEL